MTHDFATRPEFIVPRDSGYKKELLLVSRPLFLRAVILLMALCFIVFGLLQPDNASVLEPEHIESPKVSSLQIKPLKVKPVAVKAVLDVPVKSMEVNTLIAEKPTAAVHNADVNASSEFDFYDNLKKNRWEVQAQNGVYVKGDLLQRKKVKYKLQAASFRHKKDAQSLVGLLSKHQLKGVVHSSMSSNGVMWYQVNVGPFYGVSKMNKAHDILVSLNMMPLKRKI